MNINGEYLSAVLSKEEWAVVLMLLSNAKDNQQANAIYASIMRQLTPATSTPDDFLNEDDMR